MMLRRDPTIITTTTTEANNMTNNNDSNSLTINTDVILPDNVSSSRKKRRIEYSYDESQLYNMPLLLSPKEERRSTAIPLYYGTNPFLSPPEATGRRPPKGDFRSPKRRT